MSDGKPLDQMSAHEICAFLGMSTQSGVAGWNDFRRQRKEWVPPAFDHISFQGMRLAKVNFDGLSFRDCAFDSTDLDGSFFEGARLDRVSFRGADLRGATFRECRLYNADLREARRSGIVLDRAHLQSVDIRNADWGEDRGADERTGHDGLNLNGALVIGLICTAKERLQIMASHADRWFAKAP